MHIRRTLGAETRQHRFVRMWDVRTVSQFYYSCKQRASHYTQSTRKPPRNSSDLQCALQNVHIDHMVHIRRAPKITMEHQLKSTAGCMAKPLHLTYKLNSSIGWANYKQRRKYHGYNKGYITWANSMSCAIIYQRSCASAFFSPFNAGISFDCKSIWIRSRHVKSSSHMLRVCISQNKNKDEHFSRLSKLPCVSCLWIRPWTQAEKLVCINWTDKVWSAKNTGDVGDDWLCYKSRLVGLI